MDSPDPSSHLKTLYREISLKVPTHSYSSIHQKSDESFSSHSENRKRAIQDSSDTGSDKRILQSLSQQTLNSLNSNLLNQSPPHVILNSPISNAATKVFQRSLGSESEEGKSINESGEIKSIEEGSINSDESGEMYIDPEDFLSVIYKLFEFNPPKGMCLGIVLASLEELVSGKRDDLDKKIENFARVLRNIQKEGINLNKIEQDFLEKSLEDVDPDLVSFISEVAEFQCDHFMRRNLESLKNVQEIDFFSGIYTEIELERYFASLRAFLKRDAQEGRSIGFLLSSETHIISIGYNRKNDRWLYIDFEELYENEFEDDVDLVEKVKFSFSNNNDDSDLESDIESEEHIEEENFSLCLLTRAYAAKEHADFFKMTLNDWKNSSEYKDTHTPSPEKATQLDSSGYSWLSFASESGDVHLVENLLKAGGDVHINRISSNADTPLVHACKNKHTKMLQLLIDHQADLNLEAVDGCTPLWTAAYHGRLENVRLLLTLGAEINKFDDFGTTPFWIACQQGDREVAQLLIDSGADIETANTSGITPLEIAKLEEKAEIVEMIREIKK